LPRLFIKSLAMTKNKQMEDNEVLVKVEHLSKKFCKDLRTSLWYGVKDLYANVLGNKEERSLRPEEFWAVKDINFELRRGECLGLIGHNGAGKSTLLKILNGLINPDEGKVTIKGRVGALIELGAGFNAILSGRENIYNNGAILGFSKKEIDAKVEEIIDFAEIREFIDMPVQNYSSGMKVRLGFAVAAQMEPDVLIIDEVLAVGDLGFRMKCLTRIGSLLSNTAVIFVSHGMPQVARISNKILLMQNGKQLVYDNNISLGIKKYYESFKNSDKIVGGNGKIKITEFKVFNANEDEVEISDKSLLLRFYEKYKFIMILDVEEVTNSYEIHFSFIDKDSKIVATLYSYLSHKSFSKKGQVEVAVYLDKLVLGQGSYSLGIAINEVKENGSNGEIYLYDSNISSFQVTGIKPGIAPVHIVGKWLSN